MALMPGEMTFWHNPRCRKSREALALLQERGVQPKVRLYLQETPSEAEVIALRDALGLTADEMMRKGEKVFKELGLATADEAGLIDAMVAHPILIERPVLIEGSRAVIGRPPERVLELI
ncbi:MAG: arsenate reductase (glutaredoxin) [Pseudomonadota bacterium]